MLKEKAVYYYKNGYNCSQCILRAAADVYEFNCYSNYLEMACAAVNTGFGVKSICSVTVSAIMLFGILFDADTAKRLRILLLDEFYSTRATINCSNPTGELDCTETIGTVAEIAERLIKEEKII